MKKSVLTVLFSLLMILVASAQDKKVEVLYFKANLACCKARACNALQADVDSVVVKYFAKEKIAFKVVMLADEANKKLVEKYKAQSQTVVLVKKKKKKETVIDLTSIVKTYTIDRDKAKFEADMKKKISESIK